MLWGSLYKGERGRATGLLIALRVVYAYNWLDVGPTLPYLSQPGQFGINPVDWGILVASFFLGAGVLQVPAGLLALRWGTRRVSLVGALLLGVMSLGAALAPTFWVLVLFRGLAGAGAGLFFSPAIALVSSLHEEGQRGFPVGTFSSAYSLGAGLGLFGTTLLVPLVGWRICIALGGLLMLGILAVTLPSIPSWAGAPPSAPAKTTSRWPAPLRSPAVWGLGLSFIGLEGASLSVGQYIVAYGEIARHWSAYDTAWIGAFFVFVSLFGGPFGGRLAERHVNRRTQFLAITGLVSGLLLLIPSSGIVLVGLIAIGAAFLMGMLYAMMYVIPPYLPGLRHEDTSLAIGLLNGIQLVGGGAMVTFLIAWIIQTHGYAAMWYALGAFTVATLVFLVLIPRTGARVSTPAPPLPAGAPAPPLTS